MIDLFGFHGVAPMASWSSLERTLPRGLVLDVFRHRVPMVNA